MFVRINGFRFIVDGFPQTGRTLDRLSCPGKWGTPRGCTYSSSEPSSLLEAIPTKQEKFDKENHYRIKPRRREDWRKEQTEFLRAFKLHQQLWKINRNYKSKSFRVPVKYTNQECFSYSKLPELQIKSRTICLTLKASSARGRSVKRRHCESMLNSNQIRSTWKHVVYA